MPKLPALALLGVLLASCTTVRESPPAKLIGAWRAPVQFTTGPFAEVKDLVFMYAFNVGGTMNESSNYDGAPPVPPAYGVWRQVGLSEFEAHYEFFTTTPSPPDAFKGGAGWLPSGHGVLTERITLAPDGQSFTSAIHFEAFDTAGKPIPGGGGEAEGHGTRIH